MKIPWWQWWPFFRSWRCVGFVDSADEIPQRLPHRAAVIVGSLNHIKWLAFDCPCGTGHRVLINCDAGRRPAWSVMLCSRSRLSIMPSVDQVNQGRRCHYFVRNGKIIWAKDQEP
jgi:hypothetical protein